MPEREDPVNPLRLGAVDIISTRPLLHGLLRGDSDARVSFGTPSAIVDAFARGRFDAALVPSIEYLRGAGRHLIAGPALVSRAPGGVVLVARKPIDALERIAVGEFCRTPVAALRIVLAEQHRILPDLLVEKGIDDAERCEPYDAVLVTGDAVLREPSVSRPEGVVRYNLTEMWKSLTKSPLVHAVWVYDDEERAAEIASTLDASRDLGVARLSTISEEVGRTMGLDAGALYDYFTRTWSYRIGTPEMDGLRALEDLSRKYDLIRDARMAAAARA